MSLQDADIILFEIFLDYFSGMFWIVVLLGLPIVAEQELLRRFIQVFIRDLDVILLSDDFFNPDGVPCALLRESST